MRAPLLVVAALLLAGCTAEEAPVPPPADTLTSEAREAATWSNFTGTLRGVPVAPGVQEFEVVVPQGAVEVQATLAWTSALADLRLALVDPRGEVVETGFPESDTQRSAATLEPPASGTWKVRVEARRALDEPFTVAARVLLLQPLHNVLQQTYDIGGASLFKEVNVIMEKDASFDWTFEATSPVHYDIHSHVDGETVYHERGTAAAASGTFVAAERGIYSVLFAPPDAGESNPDPTPSTVRFRMEGAFRVHSHSQ